MYSQQTTFVIKKEKNKKSSSLFLDFIFTCVPTFNPRFGWIIMN